MEPGQTASHSSFADPEPHTVAARPGADKPFAPTLDDGSAAQAKTERPLTDGEILGAVFAANDGELSMAEIALKHATSPGVKELAGLMKTHHEAGLQKEKTLEAKTKIARTNGDVSTSLASDADTTAKDLRTKEGKDFDQAFVDAQVKAHKDVLTLMDNRMIPSASNSEVKALLTDMRKTVANHLMKAEKLQKKLDGATPSASSTDENKSKARVPETSRKAP
jgi:putative membrane protein